MMAFVNGWDFHANAAVIVFGLLVLLLALFLSFRALTGDHANRRRVVMLEMLRIGIILLLVLTLLQPERVQSSRLDQQPQLVVLHDGSQSMTTPDVVAADGTVSRRHEWIRSKLDDTFLVTLTNRYQIVATEFARDRAAATADAPTAPDHEDPGTDLNAALEEALASHPRLRTVVLLTDGDWNAGKSPVTAATRYRVRGVPIYAVGVGSEQHLPDVVLEQVSAPAYGLLGEQVYIGFSVRSHLQRDIITTISLTDHHGLELTKTLSIPAGGRVEDALLWTPLKEGATEFEMSIPVEDDELDDENNHQRFSIMVRKELLRVLIIESEPRWEYRYLRNALSRDPGVIVDCLLLHPRIASPSGPGYLDTFPPTRDALSVYDVVFVGDIGIGNRELSLDEARLLSGLVQQQASGLVFLPGPRGRQATLVSSALGTLCPVELDSNNPSGFGSAHPSRLALTEAGRQHLLTTLAPSAELNAQLWRALPGFYWHAAVRKSKPGATVLAVHEVLRDRWGRLPLLVTRPAGSGKVLFMGMDAAWRWRRGVEDAYHYRFWGQVVRWMSYQRHLAQERGFRVFHTPEDPAQGDAITIHVTAFDGSGSPMTGGQLAAGIRHQSSGNVDSLPLHSVEGGWGMFTGQFVPRRSGEYLVEVKNAATDRGITLPLAVRSVEREQRGRPARFAVLQEIAAITGGAVAQPSELETLIEAISALPQSEATPLRLRLWCHPLWGGFILLLLALYWTGRKLMGLI